MQVSSQLCAPVLSRPNFAAAAPAIAGPAPAEQPAPGDSVSLGNQPPAPPSNGGGEPQTPALKKWTVMVWSASDNNLYRFMQMDLDEAEKVGCTAQLNVVAQTDHHPKGKDAVRLELKTGSLPGLHSPVKQNMGDCDMASPHELADFIQWSMKNYPAENYALICSDHGYGWRGACQDESKDTWMNLPIIEDGLKEARMATGRKLDVLGFDACLMATAEVAHQLKDEASYLVGSQETEGGAGWQYNRVLSERSLGGIDMALRTRLNLTPEEFAKNVVTMAEGHQDDLATMTAIDTSKVQAITDATAAFAQAIVGSSVAGSELSAAAANTQGFAEYKDLYDFADKTMASVGDRDVVLAESANGVKAAIEAAIVAEQHSSSYPNAHGFNIELSPDNGRVSAKAEAGNPHLKDLRGVDFGHYANTKFAQDSGWEAAIAKINS